MNLADDIGARRARVQAAMSERGLGGLVIYFGGQHYMLRMNQLMYLTDSSRSAARRCCCRPMPCRRSSCRPSGI